MKKKFIYIMGLAAVLTSCAKEALGERTLSETGEKTPLEVTAIMDTKAPATKAADKDFANDDKLVAYLRHVTWDGSTGARTSVDADQAPKLVTFTKGSTAMSAYSGSDITPIGTGVALGLTNTNTNQTSDLTVDGGLYWDDFSNSVDADHDLRTDGHYLQSYYGYCYNGGTPTTALTETSGVLGWTVASDQTTSSGIQSSDLLWSAEQTPIRYAHVDNDGNKNHGTLVLPFTHAMSKVTINLTARDGFASEFKFTETVVTLEDKNTVCTVTAPTYSISAHSTPGDIKMQQVNADNVKQATYSAVIVPSSLEKDVLFATITNADGNKYEVKVSDVMLQKGSEHENVGWGDQLGTDGMTRSGVHYVLNVTLDKQKVEVKALLKDWEDVTADGDGDIIFTNDVTSFTVTDGSTEIAQDGAKFSLWRATDLSSESSFDADSESDGINRATVYTYSSPSWVADPKIYWPNGQQKYYFRALAKYDENETGKYLAVEDQVAAQGSDLLWGTTSAHKDSSDENHKFNEGDPIPPRTGDVPLTFYHAMTKVSVTLATPTDDSGVDITGARIYVTGLYDKGTILLSSGAINDLEYTGDKPHKNVDGVLDFTGKLFVPQSLVNDKDGVERTGKIALYNINNLTEIGGKYYDTSTLDAIKYTIEEVRTHNQDLNGAWTTSMVKTPAVKYTEAEANEHNATLPGHVESGNSLRFTCEEYNTYYDTSYSPEEYYADNFSAISRDKVFNDAEADAYNASLLGAKKEGDQLALSTLEVYNAVNGTNLTQSDFDALSDEDKAIDHATADQAAAYNKTLSGAALNGTFVMYTYKEYVVLDGNSGVTQDEFVKLTESARQKKYTAVEAIEYNKTVYGAVTTEDDKQAAVYYTQDECDAHNVELPEAISTNDVKEYEVISTSKEAAVGDIRSGDSGNPIPMLHIILADNTEYNVALKDCMIKSDGSDNGTKIQTWERGKHYKYEITLGKEEITFRAFIKNWVETNGGGNANLDWD